MGQCTFDSFLVRDYTIENPKRKLLSKGVHLLVPKKPSLRKRDGKEVLVLKGDSTTLSTKRKC